MAKLKCDKHKRRVFFINGKMIHRGGWGDICNGKTATIGDKTYSPNEVNDLGNLDDREKAVSPEPDPAEKLLKEVFGG